MTRKQIIKDYKSHFGLQDIPFRNLGSGDKAIIEWAEDLVKNLALSSVVKSDSKMLCECDAPLIRTSDKGREYCGSCEKDLD